MTEKELQERRKLFDQALLEALPQKYDEELKEAQSFLNEEEQGVNDDFCDRGYPRTY